MRPVEQTVFGAGAGNALQACIASMLEMDLDSVPNFITQPEGYLAAAQTYLAPRGLALLKVALTEGKLPHTMGGAEDTPRPFCLLVGKSPRGEHSHVVVAQVGTDGESLTLAHDPFPAEEESGTPPIQPQLRGIDGGGTWAGFLVVLSPQQLGGGADGASSRKRQRVDDAADEVDLTNEPDDDDEDDGDDGVSGGEYEEYEDDDEADMDGYGELSGPSDEESDDDLFERGEIVQCLACEKWMKAPEDDLVNVLMCANPECRQMVTPSHCGRADDCSSEEEEDEEGEEGAAEEENGAGEEVAAEEESAAEEEVAAEEEAAADVETVGEAEEAGTDPTEEDDL